MIKYVTIFCASSQGIAEHYFESAKQVTKLLVSNGYGIKYGGGAVGLMGVVANTALENNGLVVGIIPKFMVEVEWEHKGVTEMIHVETMHQRKELLIKNTSAVIALPGGTGTLEELYEVVSLKKLGLFPHPIIIYNDNGYYNPIIEMAQKMADEKFMQHQHLNVWNVVYSPNEVIEAINKAEPWGTDVINFAAVKQ